MRYNNYRRRPKSEDVAKTADISHVSVAAAKGNPPYIALAFPYSRDVVSAVRTIPLSRWNDVEKKWYVPLNQLTVRAIKQFLISYEFEVSDEANIALEDVISNVSDIFKPFTENPHVAQVVYEKSERWLIFFDPRGYYSFGGDGIDNNYTKQVDNTLWMKVTPDSIHHILLAIHRYGFSVSDDIIDEIARDCISFRNSSEDAGSDDSFLSKYPLTDFQMDGVKYLLGHKRSLVLDTDRYDRIAESVCAVDALNEYPLLIVCRSKDVRDWRDAVHDLLPDRTVSDFKQGEDINSSSDIIIATPSLLKGAEDRILEKNPRSIIFEPVEDYFGYTSGRVKTLRDALSFIPVRFGIGSSYKKSNLGDTATVISVLGLSRKIGGYQQIMRRYAPYDYGYGATGPAVTHEDYMRELDEKLKSVGCLKRDGVAPAPSALPIWLENTIKKHGETGMRLEASILRVSSRQEKKKEPTRDRGVDSLGL